MTILACSGFEEADGPNWTPPTIGNFMRKDPKQERRLREARAESAVISEARSFHEKQARHYGVDTNRGIAHFRASKMYAREGRLQEMFDQMQQQQPAGSELNELPPKAIMKAHKAAAQFHKSQADKAGLDSDLGHAHVAAMENHLDVFKKAKAKHQASKQQPGMEADEAAPGHGSKQAPMPVPKKSEMPNGDIRQNKPPIALDPADANKDGGTRLRQNEATEGGPGSGPHKGAGNLRKAIRELGRRNFNQNAASDKKHSVHTWSDEKGSKGKGFHDIAINNKTGKFEHSYEPANGGKTTTLGRGHIDNLKEYLDKKGFTSKHSSQESHHPDREAGNQVEDSLPSKTRKQVGSNLIFRGKKLKMHDPRVEAIGRESRRRRQL